MASEDNNIMETQEVTTLVPTEGPTLLLDTSKKKKKKKKKGDQEDPFKDIKETLPTMIIVEPCNEVFDSDTIVKIEDIEVSVDCNEFLATQVMSDSTQDSNNLERKTGNEGEDNTCISVDSDVYPTDEQHLYTLQAAPTYICDVCNLVFSNANTLRTHKTRSHDDYKKDLKFKCKHCHLAYEKKPSLKVHMKRKHGKNVVPEDKEDRICEICSLAFVGMSRLRMHMRRKHGSFTEAFNHECPYCGLTYDKYTSLVVHMQRKHTEREKVHQLFNCPFCPKLFTLRQSLMTHVRRKHKVTYDMNALAGDLFLQGTVNENGDYLCSECPLTFSNMHMLKIHLQRMHDACNDTFKLKCTTCNLSYDKVSSLKRHIKRKHDKSAYCNTCQKQFDNYDLYLNHSHQKQVYECSDCGTIFPSERMFANHMSVVHKIITAQTMFCDQCSEVFADKRQLRVHIRKVHTQFTYTCGQCIKDFRSKDSLRQHVLRKHVTKEASAERVCIYCNNTFKNEREMCNHIDLEHAKESMQQENDREHGIINPYQCTKCSDSYPSWDLLKTHNTKEHSNLLGTSKEVLCQICSLVLPKESMAKHMKDSHTESLKCHYCDYETSERVNLTKHLLRHNDIKPMKCDVEDCSYSTINPYVLNKHKLKHSTEIIKYQCSKCPFQSVNKYTLKYHEKEHFTGKRQYRCDNCEYTTFTQANLVQHRNKHLVEKKFKCEVCPFASKYNTSLRFHIKKKHRDLPVTVN